MADQPNSPNMQDIFDEFPKGLREALEEQSRQILDAARRIGEILKRQSEPGTFLGDYLIVRNKTRNQSEREAALMRLADRLKAQPVDPEAKAALRRLGPSAMRRLLPKAVFLALGRMDDEQIYREGKEWLKDPRGRQMRFTPKDHYAPSQEDRVVAYLKKEVRNIIEDELIEAGREIEFAHASRGPRQTDQDELDLINLARPVRRGIKHCAACSWEGRVNTKRQPCPKCGLGGSLEDGPSMTAQVPALSIPDHPSVEELAINEQLSRLRKRIIKEAPLSSRERQVLDLFLDDELEAYEIAQILGIEPGAVWIAKHRAIQKISQLARKFASGM